MKPRNADGPLFNLGSFGQGRGKVFGQQARTRSRRAAVEAGKQAPLALAGLRDGYFKARPRARVHRHPPVGAFDFWRLEEGQRASPDMVEIVEQAARRRQHRTAKLAQSVQCRQAKDSLQLRLALVACEAGPGAVLNLGGSLPAFRPDHFTRRQARQHRIQRFRRAFLAGQRSGRYIAHRDPHRFAQRRNSRQPVGRARIEQCILGQRAGRNEADDVARNQHLRYGCAFRLGASFGFVRRFGLFGDCDPVAGADQAGEVAFGRMDRDTAHGHGLAAPLPPRSQRDVERRGSSFRILEEQFEEVAHAIEQQRVVRLFLQRKVLRHHGGIAASHRISGGGRGPIRASVCTSLSPIGTAR